MLSLVKRTFSRENLVALAGWNHHTSSSKSKSPTRRPSSPTSVLVVGAAQIQPRLPELLTLLDVFDRVQDAAPHRRHTLYHESGDARGGPSVFDCAFVPAELASDFARRMLEPSLYLVLVDPKAPEPRHILIIAQILLRRASKRAKSDGAGSLISQFNVHRLMLASILTAEKLLIDHDSRAINAKYALLARIPLKTINEMEAAFCFGLLGGEMHVTTASYERHCRELERIFPEGPVLSRQQEVERLRNERAFLQ